MQLAQSLAKRERLSDFVIPAHIDDLPHSEVTIELTRINSIEFANSWAAGLATLLKKLEIDAVPKVPAFNRAAVNDWWRSQFDAAHGIRNEPETLVSNWFKVEHLPAAVYEHRITREKPGLVDFDPDDLPYPGIWLNDLSLLTFAKAQDFMTYKTMLAGRLRYWHYAFSGKPIMRPETLFLVKGHVLFSDDGANLWTNKDLMAKARRNQCRNWWNDEWRDRMYAAIAYLANSAEALVFPLGADASFSISKEPISFESPVSYLEPGEIVKDDDLSDYDFEEPDADLDETLSEVENSGGGMSE